MRVPIGPLGAAGSCSKRGRPAAGGCATFRATPAPRRARMPPSPSLSARRMKMRYLMVTVNVSAQNTSEITPRTLGGASAPPRGRHGSTPASV